MRDYPPSGTRFGSLVVIAIAAPSVSNRMSRVQCRCDCTAVVTVRVSHLRDATTRSCGCRGGRRQHYPPVQSGMRYDRWTVIEAPTDGRWAQCRCDCGVVRRVLIMALKAGRWKSCGCIRVGLSRKKKYGAYASQIPEYKVWTNMKTRCLNPRVLGYKSYGALGITVCDRWLGPEGFRNFLADMGPRPGQNYDIDRIDSTKGYEPTNSRWLLRSKNLNRPRTPGSSCGGGTRD